MTGAAGAGQRGRGATRPTDIPAGGWKDVLWRVYAEIGNDRVTLIAAGVTYYLLLALVPGLTALISLYGFFADPATIADHLQTLNGFVPGGGMDILREQVTRLASTRESTLGFAFLVSLAIALWSANAGVKSLFEAMNVAYDEVEERSFIKLNAVSLLFTFCMLVAALLLIGSAVVVPVALQFLPLGEASQWAIGVVAGLLTLAVLSLGISALYRWGPSRAQAKWRWITPGAILTLVVTGIVSVLFSWYAANFGDYNATYGSLGALIGFMTWIWLTMLILIVGGELNSELEHQTARDSTTGSEERLGRRGATMADRIAGGSDPKHDAVDRSKNGAHRDGEPAPARDRGGRRSEALSLGRLAVALPAAFILSWAHRRNGR
jgi:membrane protein